MYSSSVREASIHSQQHEATFSTVDCAAMTLTNRKSCNEGTTTHVKSLFNSR